jgi:hypothetical protein
MRKILNSLVAGSLVAGSLMAYTPTEIDKIKYTALKKIEWIKAHPTAYKTPAWKRIQLVETERDKQIEAIRNKSVSKKIENKKIANREMEIISLKEQVKTSTFKFIYKAEKTDLEGLAMLLRECGKYKSFGVIKESSKYLVCYIDKEKYITYLESKLAESNSTKESK